MAADKTPDQEPSIEEILASIRQIISDDDEKDTPEEPVAAAPPPPPPPAPKPPAQKAPEPVFEEPEEEVEDVLELTESMAEPLPVEEEEINIDLQEMAEEPPVEVAMAPPKNAPVSDILTEAARTSTISSMAKLAGNMPITRHREYGNITLEDLVREMLHPMLKDWLSDNLPPMVERMVQKELEKLARQAQDV
jgi:cell pole-organizing protein PopZ